MKVLGFNTASLLASLSKEQLESVLLHLDYERTINPSFVVPSVDPGMYRKECNIKITPDDELPINAKKPKFLLARNHHIRKVQK